MHRRRLLDCLAGAAVAGCGRRSRPPRKVRVAVIPRLTLSPVFLAEELGFFREAGLEAEFHQLPESVQALPLLAGGELEVSFTGPSPGFINAVLKGARLRIVANRDVAVPGCATAGVIYGYRGTFPQGLSNLRLLKGKRVAVNSPAGLPAFFLDQLLESAGVTTDQVELVSMRQPDAAVALMAGKIDAVSTSTLDKDLSFISANVVRSTTLAELMPNYQYSFVAFGPALLDGDPEIGVSFLEAYLRGVKEYRSGKDPRALEELARATHADPAAMRAACRDSVSPTGMVDRASVQRFADWAAKKRFIPRAVDASQLIDARFIEEALRRFSRRSGSKR